jgi:hypothetical protein
MTTQETHPPEVKTPRVDRITYTFKKKKKKKATAKAPSKPTTTTSENPTIPPAYKAALEAEGHGSPLLRDLGNEMPFVKLGALGVGKSGKSRAVVEMAIAIHQAIKSRRPVVVVDTEHGAPAMVARLAASGIRALVMTSRSLADLGTLMANVAATADILIIDGTTHIWEHLVDAYKREQGISSLGPADWVALKSLWHQHFSAPFVRARLHILFTARAGFEYGFVDDEQGRSSMVKTSMKMRGEGELAHEPTIILEMSRVEVDNDDGTTRTVRRARIADRLDMLDGVVIDNVAAADFAAYVEATIANGYDPGEHEEAPASDLFGAAYSDRREAAALIGDAKAELNRAWSSLTAPAKAKRAAALLGAFGTANWARIEVMGVDALRLGLRLLRLSIADGHVVTSVPKMPPQDIVQGIREGLAAYVDGDDADRAIIAGHILADQLPDEVRTEAQALIEVAKQRRSGHAKTSGGKAKR